MPVAGIECNIISTSDSNHLSQIYTGFKQLQSEGRIRLSQSFHDRSAASDENTAPHKLLVLINGRRVLYDMSDGGGIHKEAIERIDFCFKRSFSKERVKALGVEAKVFPLGLNYAVAPDRVDFFGFRRALRHAKGIHRVTGALYALKCYRSSKHLRVNQLQAPPNFEAPARIIFLTTTYDPGRSKTDQKKKETDHINRTRAECIRALRREFGDRFLGGISFNAGIKKGYEDCLIPDKAFTRRDNYIRILKHYPICVATTGLHGSIGWKFGEYVALSKAILSEKLLYAAPGLQPGKNFLEFATPAQCVEEAQRLMTDRDLRAQIMLNNAYYYMEYLKPDVMIMKSILTALARSCA